MMQLYAVVCTLHSPIPIAMHAAQARPASQVLMFISFGCHQDHILKFRPKDCREGDARSCSTVHHHHSPVPHNVWAAYDAPLAAARHSCSGLQGLKTCSSTVLIRCAQVHQRLLLSMTSPNLSFSLLVQECLMLRDLSSLAEQPRQADHFSCTCIPAWIMIVSSSIWSGSVSRNAYYR